MTHNLKVSIVIPVYNGSNFLREAVDSALSQTYANTEVIVVNDGSTDGGQTDAIAREYGDRIVYIKQENKGVAGAMNAGIARMTGDIFTWLSHDDMHLPEKAQAQVEFYRRLGRSDAILFSDYFLMNEAGEVWCESRLPLQQYTATPMLPLLQGGINGCTLFMPVEILRKFGPFDESLRFVQDYELWNKILAQHEFFLQQRPLVKYRVHPGQDTNKPEAVAEGDALWLRMVNARTEIERVQLSGSAKAFYAFMAEFLDGTPYKGAAAAVRAKVDMAVPSTLVSVLLPVADQLEPAVRAARSVLEQTHGRLELILVGYSARFDTEPLSALADSDDRVRLLHGAADSADAIERALGAAAGDYIAFLTPHDRFLPHKVETQLAAMQDAGRVFSRTSYVEADGAETGRASPQDLPDGPVPPATVMLHRSLVAAGLPMRWGREGVDLTLAWLQAAERDADLVLDEPLSVVGAEDRASRQSSPFPAFRAMLDEVRAKPGHATSDLSPLQDALRHYAVFHPLSGCDDVAVAAALEGVSSNATVPAVRTLSDAAQLLANGHVEEAAAVASDILSTGPSAKGLRILALARRALGDFKGSLDLFLDLGRRFGMQGDHLRELAFSYVLARRPDDRAIVDWYARTNPSDPFFWFEVASCLVISGRWEEADEIFARNIELKLSNDTFANTSVCRFSRAPASLGKRPNAFLDSRAVDFGPVDDLSAANPETIFVVSGDPRYLQRFLEPAVRSFELRSGLRGGVHVHAIRPDADTIELVERIRRSSSVPIFLSSESFDETGLDRLALKSYYSVARFLILPDILARYRTTLLVGDVDQLIVRDLTDFVRVCHENDVGLLTFSTNLTNVMNMFSASIVVVGSTPGGSAFAETVRDYVVDRLVELEGQVPWHLDQTALAYAALTTPDLRRYAIPQTALQSDGGFVNGRDPVRDATLFWSITASVAENSSKLGHPVVSGFVQRQTSRPSVLVADVDIHSVAGGGQTLLCTLLARNPGIDFYYLSRGPDLRLKEAGALPANVHPLPLAPEEIVGPFLSMPVVDNLTWYAQLALQIAASCTGRHFVAVDVPSYLPTAGYLREAFKHFGVTVDQIVLSLHGWVTVGIRNQYSEADLDAVREQFEQLEIAAVAGADKIFTVSDLHRTETIKRFGRSVHVIDMHDVLDPPALADSRDPLPTRPDLWFVGRLDRNKGPDIFVDIVAGLPRSLYGNVFVAGPDLPLQERLSCSDVLQAQAERLGLTISYEGELSREDLRERVFNGRTVVLVPSRSDTFNLVALEAVTSGTPVLLSDAAGAAAFLGTSHPDIPILRMTPDDVESAAASLEAFLADYPDSAARFRRGVASTLWPKFQAGFMEEIYLSPSESGTSQAPSSAALAAPYVQLQPDPRRHSPRTTWDTFDPRLTIVVPTYRRPEWLINCLASIAQEKPAHTRVLVIDDGSPAEMRIPAIANAYAPFVRVISTENRGEANAVNLGIAEADTPYVMILSDDDVIDGAWPGRALDVLDASGAVLAYPDWDIIDGAGQVLEEHRLVDFTLDRLVGDHWCLPGPGAVFRREDALAVSCRNGAVRYVSDYDFWLKLSARGSFAHVPERGAYWRYHGENATFAKDLRLAEEHVEIIAADLRRRRAAGAPLPDATSARALATAHLAAGVILSRPPGSPALHAHFLLAYLLSPSTVKDLPSNIAGYAHFYPEWLRGLLHQSPPGPLSPGLFQEYVRMFSSLFRAAMLEDAKAAAARSTSPSAASVEPAPTVAQPSSAPDTRQLDTASAEELAAALAARLRNVPGNPFYKVFDQAGFHLLRKHYYVPLPELEDIPPEAWTTPSNLAGLDMNEAAAHRLMDVVLPPYLAEFRAQFPIHASPDHKGFYLINATYMAVDAHLLYGLVRHAKPRRIVEIGNGASTMIAVAAAQQNRAEGYPIEVISVDPYPNPTFANGYPGLDRLIPSKVQDVPVSLFESLGDNDILFIDSSHVLRTGNDVEHEYLNLLPLLHDGVYVHVHDISLPMPYPKTYFEQQLYWNEQQMLQAFLAFNWRFNVIWPGNYMMLNHPEKMMKVFPEIADMRAVWASSEPTAFWMRVGTNTV